MNVVNQAPYRIIVTKIGLDGHDRGSRIGAAYLRDAGMEVIYTAPWQSLDDVVQLASDEDVDLIGISSLSTDHLIIPDLMSRLVAADLLNVRVVVGGIVPNEELSMLLESGVKLVGTKIEVFTELRHSKWPEIGEWSAKSRYIKASIKWIKI